jgi:signal peptidase I
MVAKKERFPLWAVAAALGAAVVIKIFLFDFALVEGRSMEPSLHSGTVVLINRAAYGLRIPLSGYLCHWRLPQKGDVVVFITPQGAKATKRIGDVTGDGELIVLGDNPSESYDSRSYGPIPFKNVIGKISVH